MEVAGPSAVLQVEVLARVAAEEAAGSSAAPRGRDAEAVLCRESIEVSI